jgi:hypothetical protein
VTFAGIGAVDEAARRARRLQRVIVSSSVVSRRPAAGPSSTAQWTTCQWQEVQPVLTTARPHPGRYEPGELSNNNLASLVYRYGRCVSSGIDPDQWFRGP